MSESDRLETARGEVTEAFERYERALVANDLPALDGWFWNDPEVLRFGIADAQVGFAEVQAWRSTATPVPRIAPAHLAPRPCADPRRRVRRHHLHVGRADRHGPPEPGLAAAPRGLAHRARPRLRHRLIGPPSGRRASRLRDRNTGGLTHVTRGPYGPRPCIHLGIRAVAGHGARRRSPVRQQTASDPDEGETSPTPRGELAYDSLKSQLIRGGIPLLSRLGEERLATELGVSRTPVREALHRLHAEGLVEKHPDGGYRPVVPDVTVMRHLYEVRVGLELLALQRPARLGSRHDPTVLEPLRDEWRAAAPRADSASPTPGFVLLDEAFHVGLARPPATGVARRPSCARSTSASASCACRTSSRRSASTQTIAEHLGIVEAVLDGDIGEAEARSTPTSTSR